jgi:chromosome partitioning protein
MRTIGLMNYKGGSGKSTLAIHIAICALLHGQRVIMVDLDSQGSVLTWVSARNRNDIDVVALEPHELDGFVRQHDRHYDWCIVDVPGHDNVALAATVRSVDLNMIVSQPTTLDIAVAARVRDLLVDFELPHAFLLNQVGSPVAARLRIWNQAYRDLGEIAHPPIGRRVAFQDSIAAGLGVAEYEPSGAAAAEIEQLVEWIKWRLHDEASHR